MAKNDGDGVSGVRGESGGISMDLGVEGQNGVL